MLWTRKGMILIRNQTKTMSDKIHKISVTVEISEQDLLDYIAAGYPTDLHKRPETLQNLLQELPEMFAEDCREYIRMNG